MVSISSCKSIDDFICHGRLVIVVMLDSQICWFPKQQQLFCFQLIVPQTHRSFTKIDANSKRNAFEKTHPLEGTSLVKTSAWFFGHAGLHSIEAANLPNLRNVFFSVVGNYVNQGSRCCIEISFFACFKLLRKTIKFRCSWAAQLHMLRMRSLVLQKGRLVSQIYKFPSLTYIFHADVIEVSSLASENQNSIRDSNKGAWDVWNVTTFLSQESRYNGGETAIGSQTIGWRVESRPSYQHARHGRACTATCAAKKEANKGG